MTEPSKAVFAYSNLIDDATITASEELSTMPANNLKKQARKKKWFSSTHASGFSASLVFDFGEAQIVKMLAIIEHNLTHNITVRIQLNSSDSWTSTPYDETITGLEAATAFGGAGFGSGGFGGTLTPLPGAAQCPRCHFLTTDTSGNIPFYRYCKLTFTAADVTEIDHFEIGRIFLGDYFTPTINILNGWNHALIDNSDVTKSINDNDMTNRKDIYSDISFSLFCKDNSELESSIMTMYYTVGMTETFLLLLEPDSPSGRFYKSFYGKFRDKMSSAVIDDGLTQLQFAFKESL